MKMPDLKARTPATVQLVTELGLDARVYAVVIIKQRFLVDERGHTARFEGAEIRLADEPWPDGEPSNLKFPADVCLRKPSTDVLVVGCAVARGAKRVKELDVIVKVGPVEKLLKVYGPRLWYKGAVGMALTPPEPFEKVELRWDYAWGGYDDSDKKILEEPRNPVGRGLTRDTDKLVHKPGPQIEDPRDLVSSHRSRPAPAGVAPLGRHFAPRRQYAGTIDEQWMKERMPLRPLDFDERYHQLATPELVTPKHLRGGELVQLGNLNADGPIQFKLPELGFYVTAHLEHERREYRTFLDTVLLEPNERRFELVWRAPVPLPRPVRTLRLLEVYEGAVTP
jgi:hypothetical protein